MVVDSFSKQNRKLLLLDGFFGVERILIQLFCGPGVSLLVVDPVLLVFVPVGSGLTWTRVLLPRHFKSSCLDFSQLFFTLNFSDAQLIDHFLLAE